ncbi:hypothetical protein ACFY8B_23500 [Streptomyces sp. NPDC012751]|uniref:nSTAND1 domain-containing NTPase n=1 Tax=Streptomyces sp. NPDC012751 TaxID=3364846 RepID=UPI0036AE5013
MAEREDGPPGPAAAGHGDDADHGGHADHGDEEGGADGPSGQRRSGEEDDGHPLVMNAAAHGDSTVLQAGRDQFVAERDLHLHYRDGVRGARRADTVSLVDECPYPGLAAFGPEQARWFFGRDRLVAELVERLAEALDDGGAVAVVAPSGAGKSSLLRAGLLPAIARGALPAAGSRHWPRLVLTPTARPMTALAHRLAPLLGLPPDDVVRLLDDTPEQAAVRLRVDPGDRAGSGHHLDPGHRAGSEHHLDPGHRAGSEHHLDPGHRVDPGHRAGVVPGQDPADRIRTVDRRVVIVVDQLEEIFTECSDPVERQAFLDTLEVLARRSQAGEAPAALVVHGLRADFYAPCASRPQLREALQHRQVLVGPLSPDELREAVVFAAEDVGLTVEPGLVDLLLRDLGAGTSGGPRTAGGQAYEAGRLPLLAHALRTTWQQRHGSTLTVDGYRSTGGIHHAVATTAERIFRDLGPASRQAARLMFLRLVRIGDGTENTRRRARRTDLLAGMADPAAAAEVLEAFTRKRMLTQAEDTVEITHEALLSAWPRLRGWIDTDRAGNLLRQRLEDDAGAWEHDREDTSRLYRGARLDAARDWAASNGSGVLSPAATAFLTASQGVRRQEARRRLAWIVALAAVVALALVAGGAAWQQSRVAESRQAEAAARRAAAVADNMRYSDPVTAMRLSLAAWRTAPDLVETRSALLGSWMQREEDRFRPTGATSDGEFRLSADGRTLVQVAVGHVTTWDVAGHRRTGRFRGPGEDWYGLLAVSGDARRLALDMGGGLAVWDVRRGRTVWAPAGAHTGNVAVFDKNGRSLLLADEGGGTVGGPVTTRLWDLRTRRTLFRRRTPEITGARISDDDRYVALCPSSGPVQLWRVAGQRRVPLQHAPAVGDSDQCAVAVSGDGRRVTFSVGRSLTTWDTASGRRTHRVLGHGYDSLRYGSDGRLLIASGQEGIEVWRPGAEEALFTYPTTPDSSAAVSLDADSRYVRYLVGEQGEAGNGVAVRTVRLADLTRLPRQAEEAPATWYSPDGRRLLSAWPAGEDVRFGFADPDGGRLVRRLPDPGRPGTGPVRDGGDDKGGEGVECLPQAAFSADGNTAAYALVPVDEKVTRQPVVVRRADGRSATLSLRLSHDEDVRGITLTPGGRWLVTSSKEGGANGRLVVWDAGTGARHRTIRGIGGGSLAVTADGRRVAAGDGQYADLSTGRVGRMPLDFDTGGGPAADGGTADPGPGGDISELALSDDGRYVAVGDGSGRVILLDGTLTRRRGEISGLFTSHRQDSAEPVTALAFSADGTTLAVGGLDGTVRLWDVGSNQALGTTLPAPADQVLSLVFRGGGAGGSLYVANQNVPSRAYPVAPASVAAAVCARAGGGLSRAAWADFLAEVPYRRVCEENLDSG